MVKIEKVCFEEKQKWFIDKKQNERKKVEMPFTKTPKERPVILPGGIKWKNEKDAWNEDFIAEVLSSQAELINGNTLGIYESPYLPYDNRVNFLKYKKPEKDLSNLNRSEVLKLINNTDHASTKISERAAKTLTSNDVLEAVFIN
ncbi:uncharacterized protein LOC116346621 [Contarinia nasturtii]|uniref:uncharacterized protein LOC116346621 n=1 Tax=Contarinia nasturtii TaxID=265458 RepID=UPI0012D38FBF|nr:uncharacterized protein LOC116346621 [Contarinia nasturtii]